VCRLALTPNPSGKIGVPLSAAIRKNIYLIYTTKEGISQVFLRSKENFTRRKQQINIHPPLQMKGQ
jgi:hypothetical protein